MSSELQAFFARPLTGVRARYGEASVPASEVQEQVAGARARAAEDIRHQYEAQISDLRSEAVEFHQHLIEQIELSLAKWRRDWEAAVPALIFAGVRAVLADFSLTDEQLHQWVKRTLDEAGGSEKGGLEIHLSPANVQRLEAFWKENAIALPEGCSLQPEKNYSEVECRIDGRQGILDASLPVRLSQLQRLWELSS